MNRTSATIAILAAGVAAGIGAATAGGDSAARSAGGQLECEIVTSNTGGRIAIEGVAHAQRSLTGTYQLRVSGPGTNINQGGDFDAAAGRSATLGSVTLGGGQRGYDIKLEVNSGGDRASCSKRV